MKSSFPPDGSLLGDVQVRRLTRQYSKARIMATGAVLAGVMALLIWLAGYAPLWALAGALGLCSTLAASVLGRQKRLGNTLNRIVEDWQSLARAHQDRENQAAKKAHRLATTNQQLLTENRLKDSYMEALQQNDQKLQMAMQASHLAVWDWDIRNRSLHLSGPEDGFGQKIRGGTLSLPEYIHPDDLKRVRSALIKHLKGELPRLKVRYRNREDPERWLEDTGRISDYDSSRRPSRMLGTRRDITRAVAREQELSLASSLFSGSRDALLVLDRDYRVSAINPAFAELIRCNPADWQSRPWHSCTHSDLAQEVIDRLSTQGYWEGELLERRADGQAFPLHISFSSVMAKDRVSHYLGFCQDLSAENPSQTNLAKGHYDTFSGLPNRLYFHRQIDYYRRMDQLPERQVAVALLQLDHYHALNQEHGHSTVDTLIQDVSARLNQYGAPLMLVARLGVNEFGLIFSRFETPLRLHHLVEQIIADLHRPMLLEDQEILPSASMGLVMLTPDNIHVCLNETADVLARAKRRGGNQLVTSQDLLQTSANKKADALDALQKILNCLEAPLRFRPQVTRDGRLSGIRVSTMLDYHSLGEMTVDPLYALAEERRMEERLYTQLLKEACECFINCCDAYRAAPLTLSFPVSRRFMLNENLRALTETVLDEFAIAPGQLELCLSARMLSHDRTLAAGQLNALSRAGFQLALEDLETWPVALTDLHQLPVGALRAVQPDNPSLEPDISSLSLLSALCRQLGWALCVTRVNTAHQMRALEKLAADLLEGEYVAQALSSDDLVSFLQHYPMTTDWHHQLH